MIAHYKTRNGRLTLEIDGEIVGRTISPGLGNAQPVFSGARHEAKLGPFTRFPSDVLW